VTLADPREAEPTARNVLVVEDSDTQRALLQAALEGIGYQVTGAAGGLEAMALLARSRPDIVLLDVVMPEIDGWQTLGMIRKLSGVPVIMLTAENSQDDRVRGLRTGADDYISKPFGREELAARIDAVLRRSSEARSDGLTGLPNQRSFQEHITTMLRGAEEAGADVTLVLVDLDDFKHINDTQGHPARDQVLRAVARTALRHVRIGEEIFRVGGEEFAIVIEGGLEAGLRVSERLRRAIFEQRRERGLPTLSIGVASYPSQASGKEDLYHRADLALYRAKRDGKNRVVAHDPAIDTD
jgi:two-component system, cell cycle response regulator